jgi:hypothetical protein
MSDTQRLRAIDAVWLDAERPGPSLAIGGLAVCAGPAPELAQVREHIAGRLARMPRLNQRISSPRDPITRRTWVPTSVDVAEHVHHQPVAAPGDDEALDRAVSRIMELPMALDRPLWDMHLLTGLAGDRFAIVTRIHHAVADGQGSSWCSATWSTWTRRGRRRWPDSSPSGRSGPASRAGRRAAAPWTRCCTAPAAGRRSPAVP